MNSAGADINEGVAALHGWGRVAAQLTRCSGVVPTFAIVDGPAVSGPALLLGLMDFVVVTSDAYAFVNGPVMVRQFTGIDITKDELGSPATLERHTGLPVADRRRPRGRRRPTSRSCSPTCPTTPTTIRRAGRSTTRPTARAPRPAS